MIKQNDIQLPLLVTSAIIINKDKVLLVKRARDPYEGFWCFVGGCGAFKKDPNPFNAVKIEVSIDLNCAFKPKFFQYNYGEFEVPTVTLFFYGEIIGTPKATSKYVKEFKWFSLQKVKNMDLGFDHKKILENFIQYRLNTKLIEE